METDSDTAGLGWAVAMPRRIVEFAWWQANICRKSGMNQEMRVQCNGQKDGCHVFTIIRPMFERVSGGDQARLCVDQATGRVVWLAGRSVNDRAIQDFEARYAYDKGSLTLYPVSVSSVYRLGGRVIEAGSSDVTLCQGDQDLAR